MAKYIINHSNGSSFDIYDLEQNGPNNSATLRQINLINLSGGAGLNSIKLNGDLTYRFIIGFQFNIVDHATNNGLYTVNNSSFDGTHTIINVVEIIPNDTLPLGNITYSIPTSENETSLLFSGRGVLNFGEDLIENSLHLLENFANPTSPIDPILGQLWYKSSTDELYHYDSGNNWTTSLNLGSGTLSFIDPQHPTDQVNPIFNLTGDDSDVGVSLKVTLDPNVQDSIFRVLSSNNSERLRVEHDGYVSTENSFKSTGTLLLNSFANDIEFANNKGIVSTEGASIIIDNTGDTWKINGGDVLKDTLTIHHADGTKLFGATLNKTIESYSTFIVGSNILYVDTTTQNVGIGKTNASEKLDVLGNIKYSGQLLSSNGTLINPGISFSSNNSVGLRLIGSDIGFSIGGTDKLTLKNDGTLTFNTNAYESLVLLNNDVPNKKYVDDQIAANGGGAQSISTLDDVSLTSLADKEILVYDSTSSDWINQTLVEADIVSTSGSIMDANANITFNGGEPLGLPLVPTVGDAAISDDYAKSAFMQKITNIPVSKVGHLNYLPIGMTGSYDGAAIKDRVGAFTLFEERDGTLVGIRVGHNGNLAKFFYFYSLDGTLANIVHTDTEYRPDFLAPDEYISELKGISSTNEGFHVRIDSTNGNPSKQYWIFNNGTMDSEFHTFRDVTSIPTLGLSFWDSLEHVSTHNLWITSNFTEFNTYDDSFNLLQSVNHIDFNDPAQVIFANDAFGNPPLQKSYGFGPGGNIQYYVNNDNIRISLKIGIWVNSGTSINIYGVNVLYDYNTINDTFNIVHPFPYTLVYNTGASLNYPVTSNNYYNDYRDKWVNVNDSIIATGSAPPTGTHWSIIPLQSGNTWEDLVDNYGKSGVYNDTPLVLYPDDASILGKSIHETMYIGDNTLLIKSLSKSAGETAATFKYSYNIVPDVTTTRVLADNSIALLSPISTTLVVDPILLDHFELSTVIKDDASFLTRHYDSTTLTYSSYDASSGTAILVSTDITIPVNHDSQITAILEVLDPALLVDPYNYKLSHITNNIFVVMYGSRIPVSSDSKNNFITLTLTGGIFTAQSSIILAQASTIFIAGVPTVGRAGYAVFEDDINSIVYAMIPGLLNSPNGSSLSSTVVIKITNDGINNGQIVSNDVIGYSTPRWFENITGIHPIHGPYLTNSYNFSTSRVAMTRRISVLGTVQDRMRETFESWINSNVGNANVYMVTIQPPAGFNVYYSQFPVFLNGQYWEVEASSVDLSALYSSPENKTFYIYVEIVLNSAVVTILDTDTSESNTLIKMGTVTTGPLGVLLIDVSKVSRFDGNKSEFSSEPLSIPIAGIDGKIDDNWLSDNVVTGGSNITPGKLFFYGFGH